MSAIPEPTVSPASAVVSAAEVDVDAPIERVWAALTAIDRWPEWNPDVTSASIDGPVAPGTTFRWKAGPGTITSRLEHVDPPRVIAWTGKTLGIRALHVWRLEARGGHTHVQTEESYDGLVARMLRRSLQKRLDTALTDGARWLKQEAERSAPGAL
jgi:uncharacterized protein YndB with AHSA1/START domain